MGNKYAFQSRYCTDKATITPAQYLAERICEKKAASLKLTLPTKFWLTETWKQEFIFQVVYANKLLKQFSIEAILAALKSPKSKYCVSLGPQGGLRKIIKAEQTRLDSAPKQEEATHACISPVYEPPPQGFTPQQSTASKLKDL